MRLVHGIVLGLLLACVPAAACAAPDVRAIDPSDIVRAPTPVHTAADVQKRLAPVNVLRGRFEQEKHVKGFRNALRSSGDFLIAREHGVVWSTRAPFASTLVLTPRQMSVQQADGKRQTLAAGGAKSRATAMINGLMLALMSGDVDALSKRFRLTARNQVGGDWVMELQPRDAALKKALSSVVMEGDDHVRVVHLVEAGGDTTDLKFLDLRDAPATLTPAEAKQFD